MHATAAFLATPTLPPPLPSQYRKGTAEVIVTVHTAVAAEALRNAGEIDIGHSER